MQHQRNDIWNSGEQLRPWRAQMKNYVAEFETEKQAQDYISTLKTIEEKARRQA